MQIAAISDIHGDLQSLKAVWRDISQCIPAENPVINAGDTVAYGPDNSECINFVQDVSRHIVSVGGNYDYNAARFPKKADSFRRKWGRLRPEKFRAIEQASSEIDNSQRQWLQDLPPHVIIEISGVFISLSHYAPNAGKLGLHLMTSDETLSEVQSNLDPRVRVVVVGHTHSAFVRQVGKVLFVNPGSVGRSYGTPSYAEISLESTETPTARIVQCRVSP